MPDRRRRRTRHHPVRRRRRRLGYAALGALVVLAAAAALLARDVAATRGDLTAARRHVAEARAALADGEIEAAEEALATSRNVMGAADTRTNRLLWRGGELVPVAGRSLEGVDAIVEVAEASARVGREVVGRAGGLLGPSGELEIQVAEGRVELGPVEVAAAALEQLDLAPLERAHEELSSLSPDLLAGQVRDARRETLSLSASVLATIQRGRALLSVLPDFLGAEGPRRYFLAMQNSAELRGTGGLIGYYAILTADDGRLSITEPAAPGAIEAQEDGTMTTPVGMGGDFERRYRHVEAVGAFANVNVDPDLPTTGPVLTSLYERRTDERIDGVIALDPVGLGAIMQAVGPVPVPPQVATGEHGSIPTPIPPERVAPALMVDVYNALGGATEANEDFFRAVATEAFAELFAGDWDAVAVGRRVAAAAGTRHLQLFSVHPDEQEAFELLGVAGAMPIGEGIGRSTDVLAVTANNAAGNKMDVHVGHRIVGDIRIHPPTEASTQRQAWIDVAVDNPLAPGQHDIYIVGSIPTYDGESHGFDDGEPGLNRTWFTVWAPETTNLVEARDASGEPLPVGIGRIHGHRAVDHHLETPSRSENRFEVQMAGPVRLERDGADLLYRLTVWRQAKAIPDRLDLTVHTPDGWHVSEASVEGGGDGDGMGVFGEPGPPVRVEVDGDRIRLTGDVTADVHLEVRLSRPWRDRLADWLRRPVR